MLIIVLHAGCGTVLAAWAMEQSGVRAAGARPGLPWLLVAAAMLLMAAVGAVLARRALPAASARLRWDGLGWHLLVDRPPADAPLQRVVVSLDLGAWLLLNLQPAAGGAAVWRIASAGGAGATWHALRVALQAHAGESAPPNAKGDPPP